MELGPGTDLGFYKTVKKVEKRIKMHDLYIF